MATTSGNQTDFGNGVLANNVVQLDPTTGLPAGGGSSSAVQNFTDDDGVTIRPVKPSDPEPVIQAALSDVDKPLVAGTVAHDAVDAGNPVGMGGIARSTNPALVQDGDRVKATYDLRGKQVVVLGQVRELRGAQRAVLTDTTETTIATAVASVFHDINSIIIANGSTTDVDVDIRDDTAGTIRKTFSVKAGQTGGASLPKSWTQTAVNKNWTAQLSASPSGGTAHVVISVDFDINV